ncbi:acetyltransferase (GNAT) family protein [Krasilnikovia cinnamomea]|uniref:Acetyltransferase (GNAT) family protein n=1 Tax=Krasilnikovia cinnamomea TaxID=349313 RepID=A0A4Q7ZTI5_9ACTN|nr:GNAT family N-acetyltransferase [Krasilnikovia cinnamomea]RZU54558.1 acetyltransferase (GNAT) family protein [Krasilnikovia cinnamomea]
MNAAIRPAAAAELSAVGALVALSFDRLDANHYLVPDGGDRLRVMGDYFTLYTEHAAGHGRVDVVPGADGPAATAVWFDRTGKTPEPPSYHARLAALAGPYLERFRALDELFDTHHPDEPHWHLAFLAVHPGAQRRGLGGALMAHTHAELDAAGVPAYLEATNGDNVRLYRRHGYTDMATFEIPLPDGTPFFRMWRPAS